MTHAGEQHKLALLTSLSHHWEAQWGSEQAEWLDAYNYLFAQSQQAANEVLSACEQLQLVIDSSQTDAHLALQKIIQAQAFADLNGQVINRMASQLRQQHQALTEMLGAYNEESCVGEDWAQGVGPATSAKGCQRRVASQQEADDLLAQLGL